MMFSDVVGIANTLFSLRLNTLLPFLVLMIPAWFVGKLFRAWILDSHWALLVLASLFFYTLAAHMVREGQYVLALVFAVPLLLLGRQVYSRLVE